MCERPFRLWRLQNGLVRALAAWRRDLPHTVPVPAAVDAVILPSGYGLTPRTLDSYRYF